MNRWTDEDSRALDAATIRLRKAEHHERVGRRRAGPVSERKPRVPDQPGQRRPSGRKPEPKQLSNGRWQAITRAGGLKRKQTFDTEHEARAWLNFLRGEH